MFKPQKMRVAMAAWEIGRVKSGLGTKLGGLGAIIEELPAELVKAAAKQDIELEIEILTPCFAHYDKSRLTPLDIDLPVVINGGPFSFQAFEHIFPDGQKVIYFWDQWQLDWTNEAAIYPSDPHMAAKLYSSVAQAMASYIKQQQFSTVHLHDYHVGLVPFFLGDDCLENLPVHFTIHNATYQGITPLQDGGYASLNRLNLPGDKLFHKYFDFFNNLNFIKACMLKVFETGGKITTVSGDLNGSWGYAAELKLSHEAMWQKATAQKGSPPGEVFVPNRHLDLFEKLPIAGITNGMSDLNRPEQSPELKANVLQNLQARRHSDDPIFRHPTTQSEMLTRDHNFDVDHLAIKAELKRLLHLEAFGTEPVNDPILMTAIGRLVDQKNLGLVADIIERTIIHDPGTKFVILASAPREDGAGQATEGAFFRLAALYPERVYFNNTFNVPLSKLILAGGDFMLIPSRFEPCGLVDYEASLVGNVVIGRATGGLTKVRYCGYLYEWLDISDRFGEGHAFFEQIRAAIDTYRYDPARHEALKRKAMAIDASWDRSATQYIDMYRYGFLHKKWIAYRQEIIDQFVNTLDDDKKLLVDFFVPGQKEYGDRLDWELRTALSQFGE
ncbi:MAG: glycogen/starch synthase [Anaerolineae bacterium]|nr:glycogen/starch synthase [Anaerolineae bacterium]